MNFKFIKNVPNKDQIINTYRNMSDFEYREDSMFKSVMNEIERTLADRSLSSQMMKLKITRPSFNEIEKALGLTDYSFIQEVFLDYNWYLLEYKGKTFAIRNSEHGVNYFYPAGTSSSPDMEMDSLCYSFVKELHTLCNPDCLPDVLRYYP